jgi:hypothetical protein
MGKRGVFLGLVLVLAPALVQARTPDHWFDRPRSPRIANYRIEAALDWQDKVLNGQETITWRNTGTAPTAEFPLHLYLNAFKGPQSLYFKDKGGALGPRAGGWETGDPRCWGYCRLLSVHLENRALDGHPGEDQTVYWVRLPRPVAPGETLSLDIAWESRFPQAHGRSGRIRDFLLGSRWYPKAGVYEGDRWNCRAYRYGTGFYADFGTYDVDLSLPGALLLAHTGTPRRPDALETQEPDPGRPGNQVWKLHAEDVHDFAWAAMPRNGWVRRTFEYRGIRVSSFFQLRYQGSFERQRLAVQAALKYAGEWFFPYPYPALTLVNVPRGAETGDRLEFPTLVTASLPRFDPLAWRIRPELATIHELGHQWFYGMLATDAAEEPWLDEGLSAWFAEKATERTYQALFASRRFQVGTDAGELAGYWRNPSMDPLARAGYLAHDLRSAAAAASCKAPLVLDQLEAMLGRPAVERLLRDYTREMAFRHPTSQDFQRIAERVAGKDLSGFWRDFVTGTDALDIVIQNVEAREVLEGGWMESPQGPVFAPPQPASPGRRGRVTLLRRGGLSLPVTLWVRLENRTEQRLTWDAQDRWVTFEFDSPVTAAILDPDGNYPLLKDRLHSAYSAQPPRRGLHYWAQLVWSAVTGLLQGAGLG